MQATTTVQSNGRAFRSKGNLLMFEETRGEEVTEDEENGDKRASSGTGAGRVWRRTGEAFPLLHKALDWGFSTARVAGKARKNSQTPEIRKAYS